MDGGNWGVGLLTAAVAAAGRATGSDTEGVSGGPEGTGEGGTKGSGAEGPVGGRACCGVEYMCGDKDCMVDALGDENELVVARGEGDEDRVVVAAPSLLRGGVPGGVVSIPLSSIIAELNTE